MPILDICSKDEPRFVHIDSSVKVNPIEFTSHDWFNFVSILQGYFTDSCDAQKQIPITHCTQRASPDNSTMGIVLGTDYWDEFTACIHALNIFLVEEISKNIISYSALEPLLLVLNCFENTLYCVSHLFTVDSSSDVQMYSYSGYNTSSLGFINRTVDLPVLGLHTRSESQSDVNVTTKPCTIRTLNCICKDCPFCADGIRLSKQLVTFPWQLPWSYRMWKPARIQL